MSTTKTRCAVLCALLLAAGSATAGTITATALPASGSIGDTITVNLAGDFTAQSTLGGGFDLFFDSSHLAFVSFGFSDAGTLADNPLLRRTPDVLDGELNGIGFGNFDGIGGIFELAVVQFQIISAGSSDILLAVNEGGPPSNPGGFYTTDGFALDVNFAGTQVSTIPLPAAVWLLGTAAGLLLGFSRRR